MKKLFITLNFVFPVFVFAAEIADIMNMVDSILGIVLPTLMVIATIVFIWGIIMFITAAGSDDKRKEGKNLMIWGVIGLFVMVAMWGLVQVIGNTFGVGQDRIPRRPGDITF
jgi:hypothetical protein